MKSAFAALFGDISFLMGLDRMKSSTWCLQPSISPSLLDCDWVGVYLLDWHTFYEFSLVRGETPLQVFATLNQQPVEIKSDDSAMAPFGLVVFSQRGALWLWMKV